MNTPIPTESTTGGDMTAANQDPSEELRLLRDRIAEFERQQTINSPKDGEKKGTDDESAGKKLEQSKKTILTLGGQWRRCGDLFRIAGAIVLFIFLVYVMRELNEQKEYRLKMNGHSETPEMKDAGTLYGQNDKIESNNVKESTADQEEEQKKSDQLKHLREEIKQFELELKGMKEIGNFSMAAQEEEEQTKLEELKHLREKITQFELELKGIKEIDPYRIAGVAGAIVLLTFVIYTVLRLNAQNSIVVAELEQQKQANANKFAELEGHQNQQQQNIDALTEAQKRNGLIPQQNRWNSSMCHKDLTLSELDPLIVKKKREANHAVSSVLAVEPIPKEFFGISYFEVKILKKDYGIQIGLAYKQMPLDKHIQEHAGTYAYDSCGRFWGHEVEGCSHNNNGRRCINGNPPFAVGDVVGCGVNLATRQIFYTLNGQRLETGGLFVTFAADLFPCVTLVGSGVKGVKIEANFGPDFKYKF